MIGVTVDQYQIQQSMGKAVEGEWFLAVNQSTGDTVELLAIDSAIVSQPGFREGFLEDASELIGIEHPNLVAVINVLDEDGALFLVQEHIEGQKLSDLMNKRGALPPEQVLPVLKGILKGIGICNSEGMVHRFLNPNNLVIGHDGEPRITGLGHVLPSVVEQRLPEKHRAYAAQYWSPERLRNPDTTDIRANVYAAGVILYEMLMGRPPYHGDYEQIENGHQSGNYPPMHNIPDDLAAVTAQALSPQPEGRFQNTVEFYKALDKLNLGKSMPLVPGSMSDSFDLAAATMDSAISPDNGSSVDFSLDLPSENEGEDISLGLPTDSGSNDLDHLDFGSSGDNTGKDDTDDTISDGPAPSGLSSAAHEVKVDADFDFDPNGGAVSESEFTFGDAGSGFDFDQPQSSSDQAGSDDFGFGQESGTGNDDFGFGQESESGNDDFGFGQESSSGNDDFGFGQESGSGNDDFGFGQESGSGNDDFGFGEAAPESSASDFGFSDESAASGGSDFDLNAEASSDMGFDFGEPASQDNDLGFGDSSANDDEFGFNSAAAESGDDSFGFGSDASASEDSSFGFGSDDAGSGGDDFGFGDDDQKAHQDEMLLASENHADDNAMPVDDNQFSFSDEPEKSSDSGFNFGGGGDSQFSFGDGDDQAAESKDDGGFDFGGGGSSQFSFDQQKEEEASSDGGFDFGDGGGSQFSFDNDASQDQEEQGSSQFSFDDDGDSNEGGGSQFNFDAGSEAEDKPGDSQFDFGGGQDSDFNFDGDAPSEDAAGADQQGGDGFNFEDGGGFDFTPEASAAEEKSEFDFGNQDHGGPGESGSSENEFDFGNDEDPFGGSESKAKESEEDDPFADFADDAPAKDEHPSQKITTDDGAFSFETDDTGHDSGSNSSGLASSLSAADSQLGEKTDIIQVKRVRKVDTKILVGTIALALIAAIGGFLFWRNHQATQVREATLAEIRQMIDSEQYNQAIGVIDGHLASGVGSDFQAALLREKDRANSMKDKINQQIASLLQRAEEAEKVNNLLSDGQTDAYAAYMNILKLDNSREKASVRALEIRERYHNEAEALLLDGKELQALEIYNHLAKADRADQEARNRARDLSQKLREERSGSLQESIDSNYARRQYTQAVPYFTELANIDPSSDYVKRMRKSLGDDLVNAANEMLAKRKFDDAARIYQLAIDVDPDRSDARSKLGNLEEESIRYQTNRTSEALTEAVTKKDYSRMYDLAVKLNELDPGNQIASGALDTVRTEVLRLVRQAESKRESGLYKEAADLYKQAYLIDQNPDSQALWQKYERWTPPEGMAYVPPGEFEMGERRPTASSPKHTVFISGFYVDLYEVTNRQFKAFVDQNPKWQPGSIDPRFHDGNYLAHWVQGKPKKDDLDRPVTFVSWFVAREYAAWRGNRLLTEAEWEKAARGRTDTKYWWGDYSDAKKAVYQFYPEKKPAAVSNTEFPPNNYGVYHILGNVHEWVQDSFSLEFYAASDGSQNPVNETQSNQKVFRGGSFNSRGRDLEVFLRNFADPRTCAEDVGFRTGRTANIE